MSSAGITIELRATTPGKIALQGVGEDAGLAELRCCAACGCEALDGITTALSGFAYGFEGSGFATPS